MKNLLRKTTMIITAAMSLISMNVIPASAANTKDVEWSVTSAKGCQRTGLKEDNSSIYIYNKSAYEATINVYGISDDDIGYRDVGYNKYNSSATKFKTIGLKVPKNRECIVYQYVYENGCESATVYFYGVNSQGVWSPDSVILGNYTAIN